MLPIYPNYSQLITKGEKISLFDNNAYNRLAACLESLAGIYKAIRDLLAAHSLPTSREWIDAIANDGKNGVIFRVKELTEAHIKETNTPAFLASIWRKNAVSEIPGEVFDEAESLHEKISLVSDGLPLSPSSFLYDDKKGVTLDTAAVLEKIKAACSFEVSDQFIAEAEEVLSIARRLKELEMKGVNARELCGKYVTEDKEPDKLRRYSDIVLRRHLPGNLTPADITPFVMAQKFGESNTAR